MEVVAWPCSRIFRCGTHHFLTTSEDLVDRGCIPKVWHHHVPSKVSVFFFFFLWRLLRDRLPTKNNFVRRRVLQLTNIMCVAGCGCSETAEHLFLGCNIFGSIWNMRWQWLGITSVSPGVIGAYFAYFIHLAGMRRSLIHSSSIKVVRYLFCAFWWAPTSL